MSLETRIKAVVEAIGADVKSLLASLAGKNQTLTVKDEGTTSTTNPASINFTGTGVSTSATAGAVTVTIGGTPVNISVGTTAPSSPAEGDLWVDTN